MMMDFIPEPREQSAFEAASAELHNQLENLQDDLDGLYRRLKPVMCNGVYPVACENKHLEPLADSSVVSTLKDAITRVQALRGTISQIKSSLDI